MPPKSRKPKAKAAKNDLVEHPQVMELKSVDEVKEHFDIPEETLYEQMERAEHRQKGPPPKTNKSTNQPAQHSAPINYEDDPELGVIGRFMFRVLDYTQFMIPLLSVHLVLNILVRMQYAQDFEPSDILYDSLATIPVLTLLHWFFHPYSSSKLFQSASFCASLAIGCYLLYVSNEEGYYQVMQRAPPLGTLWVWLFIEMDWQWSAPCLLLIGIYMWIKDYSM